METFSALLTICAGNSPVTGEFPSQRPVARSFDIFFDLCLNKQLSKRPWGWWFEMPSHPLWRHCNDWFRHCLVAFGPSHYLNQWHPWHGNQNTWTNITEITIKIWRYSNRKMNFKKCRLQNDRHLSRIGASTAIATSQLDRVSIFRRKTSLFLFTNVTTHGQIVVGNNPLCCILPPCTPFTNAV